MCNRFYRAPMRGDPSSEDIAVALAAVQALPPMSAADLEDCARVFDELAAARRKLKVEESLRLSA